METTQGTSNAPTELSFVVSERDFCTLLIDLYRNRPLLWKIKHKQYLDRMARTEAMEGILKELTVYKPDYTIEKLKKKINIIRTNYNKEKKRIEKKRADGNLDYKPCLWYFNDMVFLDEQELPNSDDPSTRNSNVPSDIEYNSDEQSNEQPFYPEVVVAAPTSPKEFKPRKIFAEIPRINVKRRTMEHDPGEEDGSDLEQYMTVTTTYYKKKRRREDFLAETWAMKLKKMSQQQKLYAEKIINDVLYEGEMGNLTKNGVSFCPSF